MTGIRKKSILLHAYGGVAKLVIALACQAGDRGFKPRRSRYFPLFGGFFSGCSAVASALGSGPRGRGFKSRQPDAVFPIHRII